MGLYSQDVPDGGDRFEDGSMQLIVSPTGDGVLLTIYEEYGSLHSSIGSTIRLSDEEAYRLREYLNVLLA